MDGKVNRRMEKTGNIPLNRFWAAQNFFPVEFSAHNPTETLIHDGISVTRDVLETKNGLNATDVLLNILA
jgi:hypothetical protein